MITERTLGIATIGQAPRDDIAALFSEQAPSSTRILLQGCLDNLTEEQIAQRPPETRPHAPLLIAEVSPLATEPQDLG